MLPLNASVVTWLTLYLKPAKHFYQNASQRGTGRVSSRGLLFTSHETKILSSRYSKTDSVQKFTKVKERLLVPFCKTQRFAYPYQIYIYVRYMWHMFHRSTYISHICRYMYIHIGDIYLKPQGWMRTYM